MLLNSTDFGSWFSEVNVQTNWHTPEKVFRPGKPGDAIEVSGLFRQPVTFPQYKQTMIEDALNSAFYVMVFKTSAGKTVWFMSPFFVDHKSTSAAWGRQSDGVSQFAEIADDGAVYITAPIHDGWICPLLR